MDDALNVEIHLTLGRRSGCVLACAVALLASAAQAQTAAPPASESAVPASADQAAFAAADAAYRAFEQGRFAAAAEQARRATALAPGNVPYARLLMFSLSSTGRTQEAEEAATRVIALAPDDAQALAERGRLRIARGDAASGRADYEAALRSPQATPVQRITFLAELGRLTEAQREFDVLVRNRPRPAASGGAASPPSELELAYLAGRVEQHALALQLFRDADAAGGLPASALRDGGYAAARAGDDAQAVAWFERAVNAARSGSLRLTPQELYETRRSVAELTRRWGMFASLNYRRGGAITPGFGVPVGARIEPAWQTGAEVWWRPFGQNNGRYVEAFARTFETLETTNGPTGSASRQLGLGARVKPFTAENLVLSASRTDTRNESADWLLQLGYSRDWGTDFRLDRSAWGTVRLAAESGRYTRRDQNYAIASLQAGRSFGVGAGDNPTVVFPHAVIAADYDSLLPRPHSSGAGGGVTLRQWFRGDAQTAPRSYVDLTLQYRAHLSGDQRGKGLFFSALLSL